MYNTGQATETEPSEVQEGTERVPPPPVWLVK